MAASLSEAFARAPSIDNVRRGTLKSEYQGARVLLAFCALPKIEKKVSSYFMNTAHRISNIFTL